MRISAVLNSVPETGQRPAVSDGRPRDRFVESGETPPWSLNLRTLFARDSLTSPADYACLAPGVPHTKACREEAAGYHRAPVGGPDYAPVEYTAPVVLAQPVWADPADPSKAGPFRSYEPPVQMDGDRPLNPRGQTGITGRGLLGKWGANFACDPIVTRVNPETRKLEMIAINRSDSKQWAIPGGMVDFGETVSATLSRELCEEALTNGATPEQVESLKGWLKDSFETRGQVVYSGYSDDPRNTDNAWMETQASHLHLSAEEAERLRLSGGEEGAVGWMPVTRENVDRMYSNHAAMVYKAVATSGLDVRNDGTVVG